MGSRGGISALKKIKKIEWEKETVTNTYGKLIAEPFEQGLGTTIGNSLRRVLLSTIEGAAVIWVKIDGVLHEFDTIPGVVEDVPDIILNLKKLILKLYDSGPRRIRLNKEMEGEIKAQDFECPPEVEIINKDLHIATLDTDGKLIMEVEVDKGYGYVPAEQNKTGQEPIGVIFIDSFFSPVVRVAYQVEDVRVGQITDYERLILEIWTNGILQPNQAVEQAAKILREQLAIFIHFEEEEEKIEEAVVDKETEKLRSVLKMNIEELELSVRASNCLKSANIKILGELVKKTDNEMLKTRNFGKKSLAEIKEKLTEYNLSLGMKDIDHLLENKIDKKGV
ncbi:MAG: DNA-directed RNA polymerase subunit alpha [bacterium]